MTSERYPTNDQDERESAVAAAAITIQAGDLIVLPTDTVYGIGADAFDADAVALLLAAKGRGREMPPPVLVSSATTLDALAVGVPDWARALVEEFWPGALTLVCKQQESLQWDLGDTRGTVAIRMPDHALAREILDRTGPLAVSSANLTGRPAALTADDAERMLGDKVNVIVDDGPSPGGQASTIVDATTETPRVLRQGAISLQALQAVLDKVDVTILDEDGRPAEAKAVVLQKAPATKTPAVKKTTATKAATGAATKKATATRTAATKTAAATKAAAAKKAAAPAKKTAPVKKAAPAKKAAPVKTAPVKKAPVKKAPVKKAATPATPEPEPGTDGGQ